MTMDELIYELEHEEDMLRGKYCIHFGYRKQRESTLARLKKFLDNAQLNDEGMHLLKELLYATWWTGKED